MSVPGLSATIEPAWPEIILRITNTSDHAIEVLNPDMGRPPDQVGWPAGVAAWRMALLQSYGYLTITIRDDKGDEARPTPLETWATPVLRPPVTLEPGESIDVRLPVGTFHDLASDATYDLSISYGQHDDQVTADGQVHTPVDFAADRTADDPTRKPPQDPVPEDPNAPT